MAKPQQPELARNGHSPADPGSVKTARTVDAGHGAGGAGSLAPIPEDNLPGHHPEHEQDKPIEAFVQKAKQLAADAEPEPARVAPAIPIRAIPEVEAPTPPRRPGVGAIVPAVAALDALRHPPQAWDEIGESRTAWLARISLLPLAAWRYDTRVRPRLEAAALALSLSGG